MSCSAHTQIVSTPGEAEAHRSGREPPRSRRPSVPNPGPHQPWRLRWVYLWLLVISLWAALGAGCGPTGPLITVTLLEPTDNQFLKGLAQIRVRTEPAASLSRIMVAVKYAGEQPTWKLLKRNDSPSGEVFAVDWDTTIEKDGPYQIEVEVLQTDGRSQSYTSGKVWIVNRIAQLAITECKQSPVVARDAIDLHLVWVDALAQLPATTLELFVEGKSIGKQDKEPYVFSLDLSGYADGQELSLNAIAIRGVYSGATALCTLLIDRQGPRVRFISPDESAKVVPAKFLASLEVEEEFGVQEVRILSNGKVVGKLTSPPFQVPVDLSGAAHGSQVTLTAEATDRAGNKTKDPPSLTVIVDSNPPVVEIITPKAGSQHLNDIDFEVKINDEAGVALVDFYILDEKKQRLDNILHTTGAANAGELFRATVSAALSLYGAGKRTFEVVAHDIQGNITTTSIDMIFGCKVDPDCPIQTPALRCLGNRCLVPRRLGDQCSFSFSCEPPLICHFGGLNYCTSEAFGICRDDCGNQNCQPGYFCLSQKSGPAVCFPGDPCDPATTNCDPKSQCTPWGVTSFVCLPTGNRGNGQACSPYSCTPNSGCVKDHVCVPQGSSGVCRRICDRDFPSRDCGGRQCLFFPLRDGGQNSIGYCN